jgi:hypothetical protein
MGERKRSENISQIEPDLNNQPVYRTVTPINNLNKEVTDSMIEPHTTGKKAFFK